eukprot:c19887_g1_i5.p1 GENE.c19887_g1_i5~~c19887_g1_i5.p1  ORF type:complete len:114 (+),score=18.10 c19887_g1_i5:333-674(+)
MGASLCGHLSVVETLTAAGQDVNKANHYGQTSLHLACRNGNMQLVAHLIDSGADCTLRDTGGMTPFDVVQRHGHTALVSLFPEDQKETNPGNDRRRSRRNNRGRRRRPNAAPE